MRLDYIKLAGFKSFVDPTTIKLPRNLTAIVGPNGCGKSNTIDAVRWVMGESSAKYLRGESMSDVIFNGAATRKPVGQASIELGFDNSDGSLGGQWASYSEISIRREVRRDGQSQYYLNGTRCRRRDITDVFLGTGLGPRSYAIIEQGTISRIIEAKPEQLRVYLEEAAGISKYKERRRETENRISHTRDNLDRLNDLREELEKQLQRLQRQARDAAKYKELKEQERLYKAQLLALRWMIYNEQAESLQGTENSKQTELEAAIAEIRRFDAELEKIRETHTDQTDTFNDVQSQFYSAGSIIARLEQQIQHAKERTTQLSQDLAEAQTSLNEVQSHAEQDSQKEKQLSEQLEQISPQAEQTTEVAEQSTEILQDAEQSMQQWQQEWDSFNEAAAKSMQQAEVNQTRIQNLEQRMNSSKQRIDRMNDELQRIETSQVERELTQFSDQSHSIESEQQAAQHELDMLSDKVKSQRQFNQDHSDAVDDVKTQLMDNKGRLVSLQALQKAALGKEAGVISQWLDDNDINSDTRLAQCITVQTGWEKAAETVLGDYLEAVCLEDIDPVASLLENLEQGAVTLLDKRVNAQATHAADTLASKIQSQINIDGFVANILVAEDLASALTMRTTLQAEQSVITRDGIWMGANWLRVSKDVDTKAGVIQREQDISQLIAVVEGLELTLEEKQQHLEMGREQLTAYEEQREQAQHTLSELSSQLANIKAEVQVKQSRLDQLQQRINYLKDEISEHTEILTDSQEELMTTREVWQQALQEIEQDVDKREHLSQMRDECRQQLEEARHRARQDKEKAHQLAMQEQSLRTELQSIRQNEQRMSQQQQALAERCRTLGQSLQETQQPIAGMEESLQAALDERAVIEETLQDARETLNSIEHKRRDIEKQRQHNEQISQNIRNELEQKRLKIESIRVRRANMQEQIDETDFELNTLLAEMPEEASEQAWESEVERITQRISRLGAINLAAIEEYEQAKERSEYLEAQNADLVEALTTLENAINKIDKETRARFKECYDKVNGSFTKLFPKIFGGGSAYLELTGEDLLDAGVSVMARPPGKRNSTIHLLSGGEKALTAIALVFSIFQLNPAPFCMLDEVDAPLDDANVTRFSNLVKEMSEHLQFIFISHNKVTMEIADHLVGVTMHEPGVSRQVSVDMEEAVAMAGIE